MSDRCKECFAKLYDQIVNYSQEHIRVLLCSGCSRIAFVQGDKLIGEQIA